MLFPRTGKTAITRWTSFAIFSMSTAFVLFAYDGIISYLKKVSVSDCARADGRILDTCLCCLLVPVMFSALVLAVDIDFSHAFLCHMSRDSCWVG